MVPKEENNLLCDQSNDLGGHLIYSLGTQITWLNITDIYNIVEIYQFQMGAQIDDLRIRPPYLFIASNNLISQYDIDIRMVISNFANFTIGYRF